VADKTLVVIRHAKSLWPPDVPDIERPLATRGRRDAPAAGRWLAEHDLGITTAWISPSVRTQQTWALIAGQLLLHPHHVIDDRIYAAHWTTLLSVAREIGEDTAVAALVGHNPGSEELVGQLSGPGSDPDAVERMAIKYPTSAVSVLRFDGGWADLAPGAARLQYFAVPRG
jgi:phosphohistidine phosphatase